MTIRAQHVLCLLGTLLIDDPRLKAFKKPSYQLAKALIPTNCHARKLAYFTAES